MNRLGIVLFALASFAACTSTPQSRLETMMPAQDLPLVVISSPDEDVSGFWEKRQDGAAIHEPSGFACPAQLLGFARASAKTYPSSETPDGEGLCTYQVPGSAEILVALLVRPSDGSSLETQLDQVKNDLNARYRLADGGVSQALSSTCESDFVPLVLQLETSQSSDLERSTNAPTNIDAGERYGCVVYSLERPMPAPTYALIRHMGDWVVRARFTDYYNTEATRSELLSTVAALLAQEPS